MSAFLVDPFERRLQRIPCPDDSGPEEPELLAIAVTEGARGQDFVTCARILTGGSDAFSVNPYTLWENNQGRAVLFVGNRTAQDHHGFRMGKPGKPVKSTVFYGRGVLIRYERIQVGIHRTELLQGRASVDLCSVLLSTESLTRICMQTWTARRRAWHGMFRRSPGHRG